MGHQWEESCEQGQNVYASVDLWVFGYKNEPFVFANGVEQVFHVPDLAKKNWSVVILEKKDYGD
jgi:hypothetical protein